MFSIQYARPQKPTTESKNTKKTSKKAEKRRREKSLAIANLQKLCRLIMYINQIHCKYIHINQNLLLIQNSTSNLALTIFTPKPRHPAMVILQHALKRVFFHNLPQNPSGLPLFTLNFKANNQIHKITDKQTEI